MGGVGHVRGVSAYVAAAESNGDDTLSI